MTRYVYRFGGDVSDGGQGDKNLLGGKGANLDGMASIGLPVPPGFTISTPVCALYYENGQTFPDSLKAEVSTGIAHIEGITGKRFGDAADPLLVSVRSGARASMPGMMDTVLNLGLNDATVAGLAEISGDARFAWDSYRRFIQMYSDVVLELDHGRFEEALEIAKEDRGYFLDTEMTAADWQKLVERRRIDAQDRLFLADQPFIRHVHRDLERGLGGALARARLEHPQLGTLDGELDVLHVAIVSLERIEDRGELGIDLGHRLFHRQRLRPRRLARGLGQILRRADAGDDVLALRVDQEFAVIGALAGGRIAGEGHTRRRGVAHVAEDHRLDVDCGAPVSRNVVEAAIDLRALRLPRPEHRADRAP